jgi:hypothetical protein
MNAPAELTVRKPQEARLGLDQQPLFELGVQRVRAYARDIWTDHNIHDPGITALEQLCYSLTDLCYRACYPIEDLLASREDNRGNMARQFHSARRALPNRPLTALDYRKLLIDVDGVRNAWIYPFAPQYYDDVPTYYADAIEGELLHKRPDLPGIREVQLRGLFGVLIELDDEGLAPAQIERVKDAARARLHQNRNLCEDFVSVDTVETQGFRLCAEIEIEPNADAAQVHARVLLEVQRHLRPGVRWYTRSEMRQRMKSDGSPYTDPDLFDGPALAGGFIDEAELADAELRSTIRLSDVISLVMDIAGVKAVREIVIRPVPDDEPPEDAPSAEDKWEIPVERLKRATLVPEKSRLIFYKGSMPVPSPGAVEQYNTLLAQAEEALRPRGAEDPPIPIGQFRDLVAYESVQQHFPALYGISDAGLPPGAGAERDAQARQLQGYLLLFDQLMANYLAQLAHARELLAFDPNLEHSYRCQPVESFREFRSLYPPAPDATQEGKESLEGKDAEAQEKARSEWRERIRGMLHGIAETRKSMLARRNRFLDHLLARFAERFQDYLQVAAAIFNVTPAAAARAKCAFLQAYPELGAERGRAFNYTLEGLGGALASNVSGLEKRLAYLLGLGAIVYDIYQERDEDGKDEYRFRLLSRDSDRVLLSSTKHYKTPEEALEEMGAALERAERPSGYDRKQAEDGTHYFNIVDSEGEEIARRIQYFNTPAKRDAAIAELIEVLAAHHGDRLCVIENILLRPRPGSSDEFLPICADPGCTGKCPGDDPYSYRLHIVLPAEAKRFRDMSFRRFAEEVIRQETPAHLLPKICFVSNADMIRIEKAWSAWRALLAGSDTTGRADKFAALAKALYGAKNVYPAPTLADCAAPEKFILGRSALGSVPPPEQ